MVCGLVLAGQAVDMCSNPCLGLDTPRPGFQALVFGFSNPMLLERYSAFSASFHPIPLTPLQKRIGGAFWPVLSALRDLDVYAGGM